MPMTNTAIPVEVVREAADRIRGLTLRTPLLPLRELSEALGGEFFAKPEDLQPTQSFKLRGAANALLQLNRPRRARGVVAVSTGNIAGRKSGRGGETDITVADLTGTGVQDTAIATLALRLAVEKKLGTVIDS
jgi:threonine synthase